MSEKPKAYLILSLYVDGPVPTFRNLAIHVSPHLGIGQGVRHTVLETVEGDTFEDAKHKLIEFVMADGVYEWARFWVDPSPAASKRRHELRAQMRDDEMSVGMMD